MSIKVMTLAWAARVGDHTDKLVLLALADNANDAGECYPSLTNVAQRCEISRRTATRSIQSLVQGGHVSRRDRSGRASVYMVHPTLDSVSPLTESHPRQNDTPDRESPTLDSVSPLPLPYKPSPSENRHKPSKRASKTVTDEPPPSNLNVEAWHRWEQYRKQIRKPIHPASTLAAQRKLAAFGPDQSAVVEQSIADGYQGLFPLKNKPNSQEEPRRGLPTLRV